MWTHLVWYSMYLSCMYLWVEQPMEYFRNFSFWPGCARDNDKQTCSWMLAQLHINPFIPEIMGRICPKTLNFLHQYDWWTYLMFRHPQLKISSPIIFFFFFSSLQKAVGYFPDQGDGEYAPDPAYGKSMSCRPLIYVSGRWNFCRKLPQDSEQI